MPFDELPNIVTVDTALPDHLLPLVEKTSFQDVSPGSGIIFVEIKDGNCTIRAVYKKVQLTGILLQKDQSSEYPTIVSFQDPDAIVLKLTEQGKAVLSTLYPADEQITKLVIN